MAKKKYFVDVCRTAPQTMVIEVEANSEEEAKTLALKKAPNEDFSGQEKECNYEVQAVWEDK